MNDLRAKITRLAEAYRMQAGDVPEFNGNPYSEDVGACADRVSRECYVDFAEELEKLLQEEQRDPVQYLAEPWPDAEAQGWKGPGWYFWDETEAHCNGPYGSPDEARVVNEQYIEVVTRQATAEPDETNSERHL